MSKLSTPRTEKPMFTTAQLAETFGLNPRTISKYLGVTPPTGKTSRNASAWHIGDICTLNDTRKPLLCVDDIPDAVDFETDPMKMKPADRRLYWQSVDLEQAAMLKQRKNAVEARDLIPNDEVARTLTMAFKTVALTLDTLPDVLERDGVIASSDIQTIIGLLDSAREQLSNDLLIENVKPHTDLMKILMENDDK